VNGGNGVQRADALRDAASSLGGSSGSVNGGTGGRRASGPHPTVPEERAKRASRRAAHSLAWFAGVAVAVHLVALYLPGDPQGTIELPWLPGADKVVHALLFGVPVYLLGVLTRRVGLVAGVFAVQAVVSELVQWRFVPYRDGDPFDALADLVGIGLAVLFLLRRRRPRR
jgi:VanZ family protein